MDQGATRELIEPGRTGEVYPVGDLAALRDIVQGLRRDSVKRMSIGLAARAAVRERTWPGVCDELLEHYRTLLPGRHPAESSTG